MTAMRPYVTWKMVRMRTRWAGSMAQRSLPNTVMLVVSQASRVGPGSEEENVVRLLLSAGDRIRTGI